MRALLVIDVDYQNRWTPENVERDTVMKNVAQSIKRYLRDVRILSGLPVFVMMSNRSPSANGFQLNSQYCMACNEPRNLPEFLEHRHNGIFEPVFCKQTTDAFSNPKLNEYLQSKEVKEVFLAGCNLDACVLETAKGAARNGFDVSLLEECVYPQFQNGDHKTRWIKLVKQAARDQTVDVRVE